MTKPNSTASGEKPKRGKAARDKQLSPLQCRILVWVYIVDNELQDYFGRNPREREPLLQKFVERIAKRVHHRSTAKPLSAIQHYGVPSEAKLFYNSAVTDSQKASFSRALRRLEDRGLLERHNSVSDDPFWVDYTKFVKLTPLGEETAHFLYTSKLQSKRELRALESAKS